MSVFVQPSPEQIEAFRDGDPIATDEVIGLVLPQVTRWAWKTYPDVIPEETCSLVNQVFAEICLNPARFDPQKASITTYAINIITLRMKDKRHKEYKLLDFEGGDLELHENRSRTPYNNLEERIDRDKLFETVNLGLSELEREFLQLMREGEIRMMIFTEALHRHKVVTSNPEREVNTIKERIKRRLKSTAIEMGFDRLSDPEKGSGS
jgi:hypothetical protein